MLCCVWKIPSSALVNELVVKDVDCSLSFVNICESYFSLKLFDKSLQCTKNNFKSDAEKELANVGRDEMLGRDVFSGCFLEVDWLALDLTNYRSRRETKKDFFFVPQQK